MSDKVIKEELQNIWRVYLLEYEFSKSYDLAYALYIARAVKNPILEMLLPSLLLIRAVSILDDTLQFELEAQGINLPQGKYKNDLYGRITILGDRGRLSESRKLQDLRKRRNELAHDCDIDKFASWAELSKAVDLVEATLQELSIVGDRPKLDFYAEKSAIKESTEPDIFGVRDFKVGIKENDKVALEWSWSEKLHRS